MEEAYSWKCPYCHKETTIVTQTNESNDIHFYNSNSKDKYLGLSTKIIVCPNPDCKEYIIKAWLYPAYYDPAKNCRRIKDEPIISWDLKPQSSAIPQPDYIPEQIRNDYYEACSILNLSPKASATLSRRCLQGMIRDFWEIKKDSLFIEIDELKKQNKVNNSTMDAIDAIRQIGNIGAHMKKDVNLIININVDEAGILIKLLEDLFQDWYIDRYEREERNKKILQIATEKKSPQTDEV